jgi:hypothetical protein
MIFYEYSDFMVARGAVPAALCRTSRPLRVHYGSFSSHRPMAMAERVYEVNGNTVTYFKDRYANPNKVHSISDEEKIVLLLKAVVI